MYLFTEQNFYKKPFLISIFIFSLCFLPIEFLLFFLNEKTPEVLSFTNVTIEEPLLEQQEKKIEGYTEEEKIIKDLEQQALDLSFYENVKIPRLVVPLKKIYPTKAKKEEIEAKIRLELLIDKEGIVRKVYILGGELTKVLPISEKKIVLTQFYRAIRSIFKQARFSKPYIEGKNTPIKMEVPFEFNLND